MHYFIAILLEEEPKWRVDALRDELAKQFDVKAALAVPPHITLVPPFETEDISSLTEALAEIAKHTQPFTIQTSRFDHFDDRVWFVHIASTQTLQTIHQHIDRAVRQTVRPVPSQKHPTVHFHINLASKDLTPSSFEAVRRFLGTEALPFQEMTVKNFTLLRREDHEWIMEKNFPCG